MLLCFVGSCPDGFLEYRRRCYGFFVNRYDRTTWKKAQEKCRSFIGGDLVSILTKEDNQFIAQKVLEINPELANTEYYYPLAHFVILCILRLIKASNKCYFEPQKV